MRRRIAPALALLVALSACSSSGNEVEGIVVDVVGDLTTVESFELVATGGERLRFVPAPGVLFDDTSPITHLRDHLRSGERVGVRYEVLDDGTLSAIEVGDAPG